MPEKRKKNIVVIGGGTGTHTVLTGLKKHRDEVHLTAVVAMTDSGGSAGRLRDEFGYLPVGDVRLALVALAREDDEDDALLRKLFLHRFATNGNMSGHNFGNLFLTALTDILGSEEAAIHAATRVLRVTGDVLPVTHEKVELVATYDDGVTVVGEHDIDEPSEKALRKIVSLSVTPQARVNGKVVEAFRNADLIIFGPGDLYTSVLANSVIDGFKEALSQTKGKVVYVSNLMTKWGQTTNMSLSEHVSEVAKYTGRVPDAVLVNNTVLPDNLLLRYAEQNEYPVVLDAQNLSSKVLANDFLASEEVVKNKGDILKRSLIRHDPHKLASAILALF